MADKVYISINAKKINYDCPFYQQDGTTGKRFCIEEDVVRYIGGVNSISKEKKAYITSCDGCKNFGMTAIKHERHLTKDMILKIRGGRTYDLVLRDEVVEKKTKKNKNRDVFSEDK